MTAAIEAITPSPSIDALSEVFDSKKDIILRVLKNARLELDEAFYYYRKNQDYLFEMRQMKERISEVFQRNLLVKRFF